MKFIDLRRRRLAELTRNRPQFAELFTFYGHLYDYFAAWEEDFLTFSPEPENLATGRPLITAASLHLDRDRASQFLQGLARLMREHGAEGKEDLDALDAALAEGRLDLVAVFGACLERERAALQAQVEGAGVLPVLTEYLFQTALSYALLKAREEGLEADAAAWEQSFCPLCGSLPAMGEIAGEEGKRLLHCGTCGEAWNFPRLKCTFCGNTDAGTLEYFTAEGESAYRVDVCRACSCYLKTVDSRQAGTDLPMDVEDVSTLHLDLVAQREGFTRGKAG